MPKSIKQVAEERAAFRAACRSHADRIVNLILEQVDQAPADHQGAIISMVQTELQIAVRHSKGEDNG